MKITVSNYASKRSELLENSNKKLVEIVEGLTTDTVEVYGLDPEIDESIDVILEQINKALEVQAKPKEEPEKPSPKEVKKISKAKSLLGISKDNKEKGKAFAKSKQKKAAPKPQSKSKPASVKKLFKGTLDEGDIVKDLELDKTLRVQNVNGDQFEGVLLVDENKDSVVIKPISKAKVKAKEIHLKSPFEEGQLVKRGKLLFLVKNAKSNTVSLEEIDGKMLKNQSIEGFKPAPIALLDERISKTKASIRLLEKKIEKSDDIESFMIGRFYNMNRNMKMSKMIDIVPILTLGRRTICFNWKSNTATTSRYIEALACGIVPLVWQDYDSTRKMGTQSWQRMENISSSKDMANAGFGFVRNSDGALVVSNKNGYSFKTTQTGDVLFSTIEFAKLSVVESSNYSILNPNNFKGNTDTPTSIAKDGTYWYDFSNSDNLTVTMYTADYATDSWKLVDSSNQYVQVDEPAADRDFWVLPLSQGVDGYVFYRNINGSWVKLDTTDQSTLNGMIFEDFNFPDTVPAPELYQNSMLAIDMGNTEGVVKKMEDGEWHVVSGTNLSGSGLFGRSAQRQIVVQALQAVLVGNEDIRSEWISYNLICVPGYVETLDECVTLNVDRKETAFIITDVPARLDPTGNGNDVQAWASNANNAASNGDVGRTTTYDYAAEYMGWCLSTNVDGTEIAVPGSTIAMRTIAYSDSISHVWNPPAGTSNGVVTNASSVGFINSEGEYQSVQYSEGQRDVMYSNNINPIAMRPTRGLLIWGQKTLSADSTSALSRVNVARLMCYIRKQVAIIAEPFLFRLNTPSTRQEFTGVMNAFFSELVQNNALYDFTVVCDESNNTSARIVTGKQ